MDGNNVAHHFNGGRGFGLRKFIAMKTVEHHSSFGLVRAKIETHLLENRTK